jgi:ABC-type thiamine transport system ATPase subunit
MTRIVLNAVSDGPLLGVSVELVPGITVILGADSSALARMIELCTGVRSPARGLLLVDGERIDDRPLRRKLVASLLEDEALPEARDVSGALSLALRARDDRRGAAQLLEEYELTHLGSEHPGRLRAGERRALGLALALSHERADILALYEPFAAGTRLPPDRVKAALEAAAARGAVVIVCTRELDDARRIGGNVLVLDQSGLAELAGTSMPPDAVSLELRVKSDRPRDLVAALASDEAVSAVRFDERSSVGEIEVSGRDIEVAASAVSRHAVALGVSVSEIRFGAPPLEGLLAARAAIARRYYEASYASVAPKAAAPQVYAAPEGAPGWAPYFAEAPVAPARTPDQSVTMPTEFADPGSSNKGGDPK